MTRVWIITLTVLLGVGAASAEVPLTMTHQGVLQDSHGDPVPDGEYQIRFRLYTVPSGGTAIWTETLVVTCEDGYFSIILGGTNPLDLPFDRTYYLELILSGEDPMEPRIPLTTVPYAIRALNTEAGDDGDWTIAGDNVYHIPGQVAIGAAPVADPAPSSPKLYVEGTESGIYALLTEPDAAADERAAVYAERQTTERNDGSGTAVSQTNNAVTGYNSGGDSYTFGVAGYTWFNYPQTGGVIGACANGTNWGALGYHDGNGANWGLYTPGAAYVGQTLSVEAFHMYPGAVDGYVLTCTDAGFAYWEPVPSGFDLPYEGAAYVNGPALKVSNTYSGSSSAIEGEGTGYYGGYFTASQHSTNTHAVHGQTTNTGSIDTKGVYGESMPTENYGIGGYFKGGYKGVVGYADSDVAEANYYYGVHGMVDGVYGFNYGVRGDVSTGDNTNYGVYGSATADGANYGVYGVANNGATNYAGYFAGDVHVNGTLSKSAGSFLIDHPLDPENMTLSHSFVESPDMMNIYNGNVMLDAAGEAWVTMPAWFEALNRDVRYQLTAIGGPGPDLYIAERMDRGRFKIAGGHAGLEVSWQVTGIRQDPFAETHRIPVEAPKSAQDRGKYLNPELYGQPESMGMHRQAEDPKASRDE